MTTTNVQPTKGPVRVVFMPKRGPDWSDQASPSVIDADGNDVMRQTVAHPGMFDAQRLANMNLLADALNTHTLTGLTPSELVEKVKVQDEKIQALTKACEIAIGHFAHSYVPHESMPRRESDNEYVLNKLRSALTNAGAAKEANR